MRPREASSAGCILLHGDAGPPQFSRLPIFACGLRTASRFLLRQRYALRRAADYQVLDFYRGRRNSHYLVTAVDNLALTRNENVLSLGKKNLFGLSRMAGETKKFQRNRRGWCRCLYLDDLVFRVVVCRSSAPWCGNHGIRLRHENVSSRALVLDLLGQGELIEVQCGIETLRSVLLLPGC